MRGGGVGQKVLFRPSWNRVFFPAWILAKAISMTNSDMLYWLDISTFYFYEPLQFQIFVPCKLIKIYALPCLLSFLQSTTTKINISINMFICFYEKSFFLLKYTLKGTRNSYFCVTPKIHRLMFCLMIILNSSTVTKKVIVCFYNLGEENF